MGKFYFISKSLPTPGAPVDKITSNSDIKDYEIPGVDDSHSLNFLDKPVILDHEDGRIFNIGKVVRDFTTPSGIKYTIQWIDDDTEAGHVLKSDIIAGRASVSPGMWAASRYDEKGDVVVDWEPSHIGLTNIPAFNGEEGCKILCHFPEELWNSDYLHKILNDITTIENKKIKTAAPSLHESEQVTPNQAPPEEMDANNQPPQTNQGGAVPQAIVPPVAAPQQGGNPAPLGQPASANQQQQQQQQNGGRTIQKEELIKKIGDMASSDPGSLNKLEKDELIQMLALQNSALKNNQQASATQNTVLQDQRKEVAKAAGTEPANNPAQTEGDSKLRKQYGEMIERTLGSIRNDMLKFAGGQETAQFKDWDSIANQVRTDPTSDASGLGIKALENARNIMEVVYNNNQKSNDRFRNQHESMQTKADDVSNLRETLRSYSEQTQQVKRFQDPMPGEGPYTKRGRTSYSEIDEDVITARIVQKLNKNGFAGPTNDGFNRFMYEPSAGPQDTSQTTRTSEYFSYQR